MSTDLTNYDEAFAKLQERYAETERSGGDFLSLRGGVLSFQDEPLPGNQMCVIILDAAHERTYYDQAFDDTAEFGTPPVCYAFAQTQEEIDEMAPHPSMQRDLTYFKPQNDLCATCPNNEWGSDDRGKGKACKERRRMALLPAGYYTPKRGSRDFDLHLFDDAEHFEKADIAYLRLNVMSVKDWGRYVAQLSASRKAPQQVITRVYVEPDAKSQFRVKYEVVEEVPTELYATILRRYEEANKNIIFPPPVPQRDGSEGGSARRSARR